RAEIVRQLGAAWARFPDVSAQQSGDPTTYAADQVLDYQQALEQYQAATAPTLPTCADGITLRDYWQVRFQRELARLVLKSLHDYVRNYGLPALAEPINAQLEIETSALATLPQMDAYLAMVGNEGLLPNGFPIC